MKNKYLGIICLIYSSLIGYVWSKGILKNFISPSMQIYIKASLFALIIIGISLLFINSKSKFKVSDLILLLPVVLLILSGDGNLSMSFATNRISSYSSGQVKQEKVKEENKEEKKEIIKIDASEKQPEVTYDFTNVNYNVVDSSYSFLINAISYSTRDDLEGKTIRVRGFTVTTTDYLPRDYFMIGKYDVSCCTADAMYSGFFVSYDMSKIKKNGWYEIEGVLMKGKDFYGYSIYYIKAINVKEINEEERYVYSCYSYDNGECSEIFKYPEFSS